MRFIQLDLRSTQLQPTSLTDAIGLTGFTLLDGEHRVRLAATASAALLRVAGVLCGEVLCPLIAPQEQPADVNLHDKLVLGFAFDWTGDKLAHRLLWLAQEPVSESDSCLSP